MERAFEQLHTAVKQRWAVVLPKRLGILPAAVLVVALATMNFLVGLGQPSHPIWDGAGGNYSVVTSQFRVLFAVELSPPPDARSMRAAQRRAAHRGLSLRLDLRTAAEKAQRPAG